MRRAFTISIGFNLLLVGLCIILTLAWNRNEAAKQPVDQPTVSSATSTEAQSKPFRWSQIESTNYLVYIENLRSIGCPGQTLRDIVTADVENLYRVREEKLRQQWAATQNQSQSSLDTALQRLAAERNSVIVRLLGPDANIHLAADSIAMTREQKQINAVITTPLVWQDVDLSKLNLDAGQMQAIAQLRQVFVDKIGENQDPNDPAYRERWQKTQPEIDDALAGMVGRNAFLQYGVLASTAGDH